MLVLLRRGGAPHRAAVDRHGWRFDAVNLHPTWNAMRTLPNCGGAATLLQIWDVEDPLPYPLRGVDSDNGGEFINHHLVNQRALGNTTFEMPAQPPTQGNSHFLLQRWAVNAGRPCRRRPGMASRFLFNTSCLAFPQSL